MLVVRAADGVVARQGMLPIHKLVNGGLDGKLRIVGGMLRKHYLVFDSPVGHMANDPVADDGAGSYKRFWLTEAGIEKRPVNEQSSVPKIPLAAR